MRKIWLLICCLVASMALLAGCGSAEKSDDEGKMKVLATIYPVYDVAKHVGGDRIDLHLLVPPGAEAHSWEPTVSDLKEIGTAKVFMYNGAGLEPTEKFLQEDIIRDTLVVEMAKGIDLLHGHHHHDAHEHHADGHEHHADGHEHEVDPHIWLDPMNVYKQVDTAVAAFSKADPANAAYYEENGAKYKEELAQLDADFRTALADLPNRHIVVAHEAFGYLAHRYDLEQLGIMGVAADAEPTPERMARIIDFVREHNVKTIYSETLVSPRLAEAIANEAGAKVLVLNPIEGLTTEQVNKNYDYIALQRENLATLAEGQR